jgi:hypothetical protein
VQVSLQDLTQKGVKYFKYTSLKFTNLILHIIKHPLKSVFFLIKLYISLVLMALFLTASFSTIAHEVPAKENAPDLVVTSPSALIGCSMSNVIQCMEDFETAGNQLNVSCSIQSSTDTSRVLFCTMVNGYNGQDRTTNYTVNGAYTGAITYTCPPDGYSDHVTLSGSGVTSKCNTPTGEHETDPDPDPDPVLPKLNCSTLAGTGADFGSFRTTEQITPEQRTAAQCSNNPDGATPYENYCHIVNGAGWIENEVFDNEGVSTGFKYTSIGGTFSGFGCDEEGDPKLEDESCTAIDNGRLKKVTCPDGTSMTVNWGEYLDTHEAFVAHRVDVQNSVNQLHTLVENLDSEIPTTDEILISLLDDPNFVADAKGQDCAGFQVTGGVEIRCGTGNNTLIAHGGVGAKGSTGETGEAGKDGEDGQSCQAIATTGGVNIVCKDTTQFLAKSEAGEDGDDCTVVDDGINATITCGGASATVEGVDEGGIVTAIEGQTETLLGALSYEGDTPALGLAMTEGLTTAIGAPNDYEVRNYGTVIEAGVNQMKEGALFIAVDEFFEVSFSGSCPTYSADVAFMNTSVVLDHWCRPVMSDIWPMIQAIMILGFSFLAFRVAVL